jgi:hypothetical protein
MAKEIITELEEGQYKLLKLKLKTSDKKLTKL